jgi:TolB-like protein/Tfp pilus assembly protein PilF
MLLAWMYDINRSGIHRTEAYGKKGRATILLALVLMVGGTGGLYFLIGTPESPEFVLPPTVRPKLAVLPFDAFSSDPEKAEFADAIHYELLNNLSRLNSIMVISRQSVMEYRNSDKSIPEIALELGVNALMTGAVQRSGQRVRINLSLRDGKNDAQVWTDDFNFRFTPENYFEVQGDIAESITGKFEMALGEIDRTRISTAPTDSLTAYEAYLMGRLKGVKGSVDEHQEAEVMFQEAIRLDPEYAPAYVALAGSYYLQAALGVLPFDEAIPLAEALLNKALGMDAMLVDAYTSLAHIRWRRQGRLKEARAYYERALELSPNAEGLYGDYAGFLYWSSQGYENPSEMQSVADRALAFYRKELELNPRSAGANQGIVYLLEDMGHLEEAGERIRKVIELTPERVTAHWMLGLIETWGLGNYGTGMSYFKKAAEMDPQSSYAPEFMAFAAMDLLDEPTAEKWAEISWQRTPNKYLSCHARIELAKFRGRHFAEEFLPCLKIMIRDERDAPYSFKVLRDLDLRLGEVDRALQRYQENSPRLFDPQGPKVTKSNLQKAVDLYPVLMETGQPELAEELLRQVLEVIQYRPRRSTGGYGWADVEVHALRGHTQEALKAMRNAIDEGLRGAWYELADNLNLESLWGEPEFKAMLAELEADMIARREAIKADTAVNE